MSTLQLKDFISPEFSSVSWIVTLIIAIVSVILIELYNKYVFSKVNLPNVHFGGNLKDLLRYFLYTLPIAMLVYPFIMSVLLTINLLSAEVNAPINLTIIPAIVRINAPRIKEFLLIIFFLSTFSN